MAGELIVAVRHIRLSNNCHGTSLRVALAWADWPRNQTRFGRVILRSWEMGPLSLLQYYRTRVVTVLALFYAY
jgi:hypothetical protein